MYHGTWAKLNISWEKECKGVAGMSDDLPRPRSQLYRNSRRC